MQPDPHAISDETFGRLATGSGGRPAVEELAATQHSKNRLLLRSIVEEASAVRNARAGLAAEAYALLSEVERRSPRDVADVVRHPAVGIWAWRAWRSLTRPDGVTEDPGRLAAIAMAAAVRSGTACRIGVPSPRGMVMLPSVGAVDGLADGDVELEARPEPGAVHLRAGSRTIPVTVGTGDTGGWHAIRPIQAPGFAPLLDDVDPYRYSVPDVLLPRQDAGSVSTWTRRLNEAWAILNAEHPSVRDEVAAAITTFIPIRGPMVGLDSASARDAFGAIAVSSPPSGLSLALALAHEVQHAKLNALLDVMTLIRRRVDADPPDAYYAPWRPDRRPISGLLQGAYAFMGVAGFWSRQRWQERGASGFQAHVEFVRWREGAYQAAETLLGSGRLTASGAEFVQGLHATLAHWQDEPVDLAARAEAHRIADRHRATSIEQHGPIPS
ncbi:HEXXH motif domain-containing protein [Streptosporangiaceae bacterium NEAU-GS5]|nr:HEXXH motif domain-containing protein [Streptosporangiaceae bacterium NEAU-GS5]